MKQIILYTLLLLPVFSKAEVRLPKLVGNNMILQRDSKVNIWGWADPEEKITVRIHNQKVRTVADKSGSWKLQLESMSAGGPYEMTIQGKNEIVIKNILIGDVWLCSGQSNMDMTLSQRVSNNLTEIGNASLPKIHLLIINQVTSFQKKDDASTDGWKICSPENVKNFSAVGYLFGKELFTQYKVPIGLIKASWGGTPIETWTSVEGLKRHPDFKNADQTQVRAEEDTKTYDDFYKSWIAAITDLSKSKIQEEKNLESSNLDTRDWNKIFVPGYWENQSLPDFNGVVWLRKEVEIRPEDAGKSLKLCLGMIDDEDSTYFNGEKVGATQIYNEYRNYTVPGKLVKAGKNTIAVRILDNKKGGGIYGAPDSIRMVLNSGNISLNGEWQYKTLVDFKSIPYHDPYYLSHQPGLVYNGMIEPLINYTIKGALWYQGENNVDRAYQYRTLLPNMIIDWRLKWKQDKFPFLIVQLPNFGQVSTIPVESAWAELREAQAMSLEHPDVGLAVTIDIGEANDIHPANKKDVARRLAWVARSVVYKENNPMLSPVYKSMTVESNKIRISFNDVVTGLTVKGEKLKYFAIAGADKKFVWANAVIEGNTVVVSSLDVTNPVAVRYAWADNPEGCNLYSKEGLPASPFRTDNWPGITYGKH